MYSLFLTRRELTSQSERLGLERLRKFLLCSVIVLVHKTNEPAIVTSENFAATAKRTEGSADRWAYRCLKMALGLFEYVSPEGLKVILSASLSKKSSLLSTTVFIANSVVCIMYHWPFASAHRKESEKFWAFCALLPFTLQLLHWLNCRDWTVTNTEEWTTLFSPSTCRCTFVFSSWFQIEFLEFVWFYWRSFEVLVELCDNSDASDSSVSVLDIAASVHWRSVQDQIW